jgi:hypothetical protein
MERLILKQGIVDAIKFDPILYGKVAVVLGVSISSMPRILKANQPDLAQASILRLLRDHLGVKHDKDLLEEVPEQRATA